MAKGRGRVFKVMRVYSWGRHCCVKNGGRFGGKGFNFGQVIRFSISDAISTPVSTLMLIIFTTSRGL